MKTIKKLACLSLILVLTACDREPDNSGDAAPAAAITSTVSFADQANAGEESYNTSCSTCHGQNLEGTQVGPIISGESFFTTWALQ